MNIDKQTTAPTFESIMAILQEVAKMHEELAQSQKETDKLMKENAKEREKEREEREKVREEREKERKEFDRILTEKFAKTDAEIDKLLIAQKNTFGEIGGIGNSNGDFAEEYFFNCFKRGEQTFFGEKFDLVRKKINGLIVDAEYDILLLNGKTVGIIEVKYRAKKEHIQKLIEKADSFRINHPTYANHKIYLALAALSFLNKEKETLAVDPDDTCTVEDYCKREGIAVIKLVNDKVEIFDNYIKPF